MCGHATLASAHVVWEAGVLSPGEQARFHTRSGLLTAERRGKEIVLNLPPAPDEPAELPPAIGMALGVTPSYVGKSKFGYLVEADSEDAAQSLKPDFALLRTVSIRSLSAG